jgi:hypothetical protein
MLQSNLRYLIALRKRKQESSLRREPCQIMNQGGLFKYQPRFTKFVAVISAMKISYEIIGALHSDALVHWVFIFKFFCRVPLGPPKIKKRSKSGPNANESQLSFFSLTPLGAPFHRLESQQ